jgi:cytochrome c
MKLKLKIFLFALLTMVFVIGSAYSCEPDIKNGYKLAKKKCGTCHDLTDKQKKKLGPPLWDIVGRDFASYPGYKYSKAFKKVKVIMGEDQDSRWTNEMLEAFIDDPKEMIPKTRMSFSGINSERDRIDIVEFLNTLKTKVELTTN